MNNSNRLDGFRVILRKVLTSRKAFDEFYNLLNNPNDIMGTSSLAMEDVYNKKCVCTFTLFSFLYLEYYLVILLDKK